MVDFDRSMLGVESAPIRYDVEKGAIRKFVEAIGDPEPIYRDEKAAQAAGSTSKEGSGSGSPPGLQRSGRVP